MIHLFRGWIPTVAGNLSFSAFGDSDHPLPAISANVTDGVSTYIVSYQARDTSDFIAPFFRQTTGSLLFKRRGNFRFICVAKSRYQERYGQDKLIGYVYIVTDKSVWRKIFEPGVKSIQETLTRYRDDPKGTSLDSYFQTEYDRLLSIFDNETPYAAEFELSRSGVVEIRFDDDQPTPRHSPRLPADQFRRLRMIRALSAQLFFFLRDIGHRHQHHHPKTDTIVDLYVFDGRNDVDWRLSTLYSMYRKIIQYKRNQNTDEIFDALGILAYAKSFRSICRAELDDREFEQFPGYFDDNMEQSIGGIQSRLLKDASDKQIKSDSFRNVLLGVVGITISLATTIGITDFKIEAEPHSVIRILANIVIKETPLAVAAIAIFLYLYYIVKSYSRPESGLAVRNIIRILHHKSPNVQILTFFALSMLVLIFTLLLDYFLI